MKTLWSPVLLMCVAGCAYDPAPGLWHSTLEPRNQHCRRMSQQAAHDLYPGLVPDEPARRLLKPAEAMTCSADFVNEGERPPRDEAVLSTLSTSVRELTLLASSLTPGKPTWVVDAYYPDVEVSSKIAVALRNELFERGLRVSDRAPLLAAGDIAILASLPASEAFPLACRRYFAEGSLGDTDALLGVMIVDSRETQLHAGVCQHAQWRWLR